jgi:uncharacterized cupin superfamily protein
MSQEFRMAVSYLIDFGIGAVDLNPAPINQSWILEGEPVARNKLVSMSADGNASTWMWDCTAGKFNWFYDIDETVYVIEGSVIIKEGDREPQLVSAGDTIFFPKGSSAEWTVQNYIRKVAFLRTPLPLPIQIARRAYHMLKRVTGRGGGKNASPAMFPSQ